MIDLDRQTAVGKLPAAVCLLSWSDLLSAWRHGTPQASRRTALRLISNAERYASGCYSSVFCWALAQLSRRPTILLNTGWPGRLSVGSAWK